MKAGPIDSVDHWGSLSSGGKGAAPRTEVVLAGIDSDKQGAAIRVGDFKLLVGSWGTDTWCDLNMTGFSPQYPAPVDPSPKYHGPGGEGGLYCAKLPNSSLSALSLPLPSVLGSGAAAKPAPSSWTSQIKGLYNVVKDPRELNDLQQEMPKMVASMHARLVYWNGTTAPTIHNRTADPKARLMVEVTECMSPWQDWPGPAG